jgi:hypothetical protein
VETELHGRNFPEPPLEIIENDPEFEVEQIVGSRRVGKKKSLQYKIRWKGYSPAHDSWEPVAQIHAPELIKRFQKTKSSHQNNATINYQLASGILPKQQVRTPPRDCGSLTETESSELIGVIDKGSTFGKRTQGGPTARTGNCGPKSSSNSDKRRGRSETNITTSPSTFRINSCTMDNNYNQLPPPLSIEELRNMDFSSVDPEKKVYDELLRVMDEMYNHPAWDIEAARNADAGPSNPIEGPINKPPSVTAEEVEELEYEEPPRSDQVSPALTDILHPGYPYRENIGDNNDLPKPHYSRPYLAAQVDYVTGDPRVRGKDEKGDIPYDEGPLTATPFDTIPEDIEDEVATYPFGENAYLDTDFLRAMGNLDDRGIAAEGLRLVQLQGEFRYLDQWQRRLEKREQEIHLERGDLIQKKHAAHARRTEVYKRLRAAKAASRITPRLIARPEGPSLAFPHPTRPYPFPPKEERRKGTPCHWCGSNSLLYRHRSRDCGLPHQRCDRYKPGRCTVPEHHGGYYSYLDHPQACPYNGNHEGVLLSGEHA